MSEPKPGASPARIRAAFRWVTATESFADGDEPRARDAPSRRRLKFAIALGIVAVTVSSAVAGYRAELFNEYAAQSEGLYRQQLVTLQQRERQSEEQVTSDLRQFGTFEQDHSLAQQLQQQANRTTTGSLARRLRAAAQGESTLAGLNQTQNFQVLQPTVYTDGTADYEPGSAYLAANERAFEDIDPAALRREARADRIDAVNMTGVTVLFVFALVLLTLSQVTLGGPAPATPKRSWTLGHSLASLAVVFWVAAAVLFTVVLV